MAEHRIAPRRMQPLHISGMVSWAKALVSRLSCAVLGMGFYLVLLSFQVEKIVLADAFLSRSHRLLGNSHGSFILANSLVVYFLNAYGV